MTRDEAVLVMTDVAMKRRPHSRSQLKDALFVLEGHKNLSRAAVRAQANSKVLELPHQVQKVSDR